MLLTAGIVKLSTMLRRPRVNSLCILALMVLLGGWMIMVLTGILSKEFSGYPIVGAVFGLTGVAALVAALVLSIAGLVRDRARYNEFIQGKGQGVTALILSILLLTVTGLAIGYGWTAWWVFPKKAGLEITDTEEFEDLNFRIGKPDYPWVRMSKGTAAKDAQALYYHAKPELFMSVVAEVNELGMSRNDLQSVALARLKSVSSSVEEAYRESHVLGGVSFVRVAYKISGMKGTRESFCYEQWLACTSRHAYQFNCWSALSSMDQLRGASKAWMDTFALLEPAPDSMEGVKLQNENSR
ncbi:MAG: hypothetical protein EOP86_19110 [Verrucomicrobiaceae bacterium]|nr:MAG: hypothetical protein EOP86_19110 [Verrucomicrobiaceae bacterium]